MRAVTSRLTLPFALSLLAGCGGRTAMDVEVIVCPPGQSACHGTCVDEQTDDNNCGGCGVVCAAPSPSTATCVLGRCLVTLASGDFANFAVGPTDVYWTTENTVMTVPIGGGTPTTFASGQDTPLGIAVDATSVYWTNYDLDGTVMKAPIAGGKPTTLASGQVYPARVVVHGASVCWATWTNQGKSGTVLKVPVTGGTPTTLASGQHGPDAINIDATSVYWTTDDGVAYKVPIDGGTPTAVVSASGIGGRLAVDATNVYYCTSPGNDWSNGGTVMKMPIGGGASTTLASGNPRYMAVDATSVYWTEMDLSGAGNDKVMKVPIGGGATTVLASGQIGPDRIAVDATSVYWLNYNGPGDPMSLMKLTPK